MVANSEVQIFSRVVAQDQPELSLDAARSFVGFRFAPADEQRMQELAERNDDGTITPEEREELAEYVRVTHLLAVLHAKGTLALRAARAQV